VQPGIQVQSGVQDVRYRVEVVMWGVTPYRAIWTGELWKGQLAQELSGLVPKTL
jgi:hypothetical protein